ncbi:uncharacterized protein LOC134193403 [Corticium candelabrum]|uniref:uncharacterized protein LOC134193403 n=1 Tax=Corticium candelabrum TaxID=121492 RepID=UPI002E276F19|nr:uncharacterized protein LOC134193403 [Corticium candelabrum]
MITVPKNSAGKAYVVFSKEHVTRHELLRFESYDVYNDQWVIRTWDGRHLAVDDDGRLIVKTGCVTTKFLRFVSPENLLSCFESIQCKMILCGTSINSLSIKKSFIVKQDGPGTPVLSSQCQNYQNFKESGTLRNLQNSTHFVNFLLTSSDSVNQRLTSGLKRMCPRAFDPSGNASNNQCDV